MAEPCIRNAMIVTVDAPDTVIERGTILVARQLIVPMMAGLGLLALLLVSCGGSQAPAPAATPSILAPTATPPKPDIHIHYLGHSAFVLQFGNGISILTDYGQSHAFGLDSPIYDVGDFQPTIVTYSHHHPDHDRGTTFDTNRVLDGLDALTLEGISLQPVLTTEKAREDNTSYLITYKGFTILHLGDAQGDMSRIDQGDVRQHLKEIFPEPVDLLLVPIGWTQNILQEAETTVALLQPRQVIPIHCWSPGEKAGFLALLAERNQTAGASYQIQEIGGAEYDIWIDSAEVTPIQVISLEPAPFSP
jgi:L-ascorbate metabolism protein UlaG (beta-lactamase superfamily)